MSKISTAISEAPEIWSVRPATTNESGFATGDITNIVPSLDEVPGDTLEEDSGDALDEVAGVLLEEETGFSLELDFGFSLEEDAAEELLSGTATSRANSYFCPLTVSVSL